MCCPSAFRFVRRENLTAAGPELLYVMFQNAWANRNYTGKIAGARSSSGPNVAKVRRALGLGAKPETETINAAKRIEFFDVSAQSTSTVGSFGVHGLKSFDRPEKIVEQITF